MTRQKWIIVVVLAVLVSSTGALLVRLRGSQKLGQPGVKATPIEGTIRVNIELPERVLDYESEEIPQDETTVKTLPSDTSYGQRRYMASDGFWVQMNVVMMGTDRTSLHKPQFCLEGQGFQIDDVASRQEIVRVDRPQPYELPVMKIIATHSQEVTVKGRTFRPRAIFVYWFVADDAYTSKHWQRMWWMARDLLTTGELQRWAYVTCFAVCAPGEEDATFERVRNLIAASAPEFQLTPRPAAGDLARQRAAEEPAR